MEQHTEDLDPLLASRRRARLIRQTEWRLGLYEKEQWRETRRRSDELIFDGQYRSLRRLLISLEDYERTALNARKHTPIDSVHEEWLLNTFAALERSVYASTSALTEPVILEHSTMTVEGVQLLLKGVETDGPSRMVSNWHKHAEKQRFYERDLMYMLDRKPGYAQDFITLLAETKELPSSKFPLLADALAYLAKLHLKAEYPPGQGWEATPGANVRKFITVFCRCTPCIAPSWATSVYSQELLHSLVLLADTADLRSIFDTLRESHIQLSEGTALHYASAFGEVGEYGYALQVLQVRPQEFSGTDPFQWACATILRGSMRDPENYHETPGIVAAFVELGVKMDLLLYDVIMHNAMDAGDYATAFKVFNSLESHGLNPDKYTFSILLHGCAMQNEPTKFVAFADHCVEQAKLLKDSWLATDFLFYTYTCAQNKFPVGRNTTPIWRAYMDLFDLTPLDPFVRIGSRTMRDAIDEAADDPEQEKLAPTPMALYLMLQTEIQNMSTLSVPFLERQYTTFKNAISSKRVHEALATLAQNPSIWNTFLLAFCRKRQYASASSVIKDMDAHGVPANVYSWNIFMKAFFKSGQVEAAERVFEVMRARGVDPDSYTYGTMVRGYAKAQLTDRVGETMQHISEDDQLAPDLLRALSQMQNRADLMASLEKNKLAKLQNDAEEADRKAKEDAERLQGPRFKSLFAEAITFKEPTHWDNGGVEDADDFLEPDDETPAVETLAAETETEGNVLEQSVITDDLKASVIGRDDRDENLDAYLEPDDDDDLLEPDDGTLAAEAKTEGNVLEQSVITDGLEASVIGRGDRDGNLNAYLEPDDIPDSSESAEKNKDPTTYGEMSAAGSRS
jgi:pentatricopeptide repeat protein